MKLSLKETVLEKLIKRLEGKEQMKERRISPSLFQIFFIVVSLFDVLLLFLHHLSRLYAFLGYRCTAISFKIISYSLQEMMIMLTISLIVGNRREKDPLRHEFMD